MNLHCIECAGKEEEEEERTKNLHFCARKFFISVLQTEILFESENECAKKALRAKTNFTFQSTPPLSPDFFES